MSSKKLNGNGLRLFFTGPEANAVKKTFSNETNVSLELSKEEIDVTDKDDDDWGDFLAGRKSGTATFEAFVNFSPEANSLNVAQVLAMFSNNTEQDGTFTLAGPADGDTAIDFKAIITNLTITAGTNAGVTFGFNIRVKKQPQIGVVEA